MPHIGDFIRKTFADKINFLAIAHPDLMNLSLLALVYLPHSRRNRLIVLQGKFANLLMHRLLVRIIYLLGIALQLGQLVIDDIAVTAVDLVHLTLDSSLMLSLDLFDLGFDSLPMVCPDALHLLCKLCLVSLSQVRNLDKHLLLMAFLDLCELYNQVVLDFKHDALLQLLKSLVTLVGGLSS